MIKHSSIQHVSLPEQKQPASISANNILIFLYTRSASTNFYIFLLKNIHQIYQSVIQLEWIWLLKTE